MGVAWGWRRQSLCIALLASCVALSAGFAHTHVHASTPAHARTSAPCRPARPVLASGLVSGQRRTGRGVMVRVTGLSMAKGGSMVGGGDGGKKGGGEGLSKTLVKLYYTVLNFVFARLRWLATVSPVNLALSLLLGSFVFGKVMSMRNPPPPRPAEVAYSTFLDSVKKGQVTQVNLGNSIITMTLKDETKQITRIPRTAPPELLSVLSAKGVPFAQTRPGPGQMLVPYVGLLIYLAVVGYFGWQMLGKGTTGKVGRKVTNQLDKSLSFDDIAGIDAAKAQVASLVEVMKNPAKYSRLGAVQPTGLLLVGPPGTGKTLLARVVGAELGLPFYFASGSDFVELFVGRGAARVRELFERASKTSPCIIFIDELDALGKVCC